MIFYADFFNGGHCWNGWAPGSSGGGTQSVSMPIPAGVTERRTFLFALRQGNAPALTITVQGQPYTFDATNQVTPVFQSIYGGNSAVHAIEITGNHNININNFVFNIPSQASSGSNRYGAFSIYRSFNKGTSPTFNALIELNTFNLNVVTAPTWAIVCPPPLRPINTATPVPIGLMCEYICDAGNDAARVRVNGNLPGTGIIGGHHPSFGACGGPMGSYLYFDSTYTALLTPNGNNVNLAMAGPDVLSDIRTFLANGDLTFNVNFNNVTASPSPGNQSNAIFGLVLGYHDAGGAPWECAACATLSVTNLLSTSATLNWGGCVGFNVINFVNQIQYRPVGSPTWITAIVGTAYTQIQDVIALQANPPVSPTLFARYIVDVGGTGAWAGQDNNIATWNGTIWQFTVPTANQAALATTPVTRYFFDGVNWNVFTLINSLNISSLLPNTQYEWQQINISTDGAVCAPSGTETFTTPP